MNRRSARSFVALVIAVLAGVGWVASEYGPSVADLAGGPAPNARAYAEVELDEALEGLALVAERPSQPGYERGCGRGEACVFGRAWDDDVDVTYGRNGCDTRNDILREQARDIQLREGTNGCVVESGVLEDPFTGEQITFERGPGNPVSIDHVFPLAAAWDLGAHSWDARTRKNFANDPMNLIATSTSVNSSKGDQTPGEWLPINHAGACDYADRYITVAHHYELAITQADADALSQLLATC